MPTLTVTPRPAVPNEADALSRLALRSKGHWGYDEEFLAACRVELTLQPEQCDGVHTVVAKRGTPCWGSTGWPARHRSPNWPTCSSTQW
ncbi:hypothetical protein [Geodermatophilus siccatus]|uniref:hypothetical protein n=1 Tax=Geodermatophilus siccatus TaxID=1137991 RepID=UPI001FE2105D|nr:hypothetical protein [Geodermatophilus siccatus]